MAKAKSQLSQYLPAMKKTLRKAEDSQLRYWRSHGIRTDVVADHGIGWDTQQDCYTVPVVDSQGTAYSTHLIFPNKPKTSGRYKTPTGMKVGLFPRNMIKERYPIIICEGEADCLRLRQWGMNVITCTGGATGLQVEHAEELAMITYGATIFLCFDNDKAGLSGRKRAALLLGDAGASDVRHVLLPSNFNDVCDYAEEHGSADFKILLSEAGTISEGIELLEDTGLDAQPFDESLVPDAGWFHLYYSWARSTTDAARGYHMYVALSVMSTVMQRRIMVPRGRRPVFPNLYIGLLGESTACRKTTAAELGIDLLRRMKFPTVSSDIAKPKRKEESRDYDLQSLVLPAEMTPESLLDVMSQRPFGVLYWEEMAPVLRASDKKAYMSGYMDLIHVLYDNPREHDVYRRSGYWHLPYPTMTLMTTSQPSYLVQALNTEHIATGFLPRIIFPMGVPEEWDWPEENGILTEEEIETSLMGPLSELWERFPYNDDGMGERIQFKDFNGVRAWCKDRHAKIVREIDPRIQPFLQRGEEMALKMAMLLQVGEDPSKSVSPDNFERATGLVENCQDTARYIIDNVTTDRFQGLRQRVLRAIERSGGETTRRHILRNLKVSKDDLKWVMDTLKEEGRIREAIIKGEHGGSPSTVYEATDPKDKKDARNDDNIDVVIE